MAVESKSTIRVDLGEVQERLLSVDEELRNNRFALRLSWGAVALLLIAAVGIGAGAYTHTWLRHRTSAVAAAVYAAVALVLAGQALLIRRVTTLTGTRNDALTRREKFREAKRNRALALSENEDLFVGLRRYREDAQEVIDDYRRGADHYRKIHNIYQSIVIVGSILTTSVTSAAGQIPAFRWTAPVLSLVVGVSAGMIGYFKFRERSLNLQQTADEIEHQCKSVDLRIGPYRRLVDDHRTALVEFAEVVERLKDEQRKREQQLEQPPEIGQRPA